MLNFLYNRHLINLLNILKTIILVLIIDISNAQGAHHVHDYLLSHDALHAQNNINPDRHEVTDSNEKQPNLHDEMRLYPNRMEPDLNMTDTIPPDSLLWNNLKPLFSPPDEYENEYGDYPSPLTFYSGQPVENPRQWPERRREIREQWMNMMGEWPPLIKNQEWDILETTSTEHFTRHRIRFNWTPDETTEGYLLLPHGEDNSIPKPAVITVYYDPETAAGLGSRPHRDFASQLAQRGFVTLSLGTAEATEAETYSIYYPDIKKSEVEPLSMLACAAANAWYLLANLPEVDSERIGITGHSFGGKWAMFASTLFDKFAAAAWSDPGIVFEKDVPGINYWEPWYLGYHPPPWRERGLITEENPAKGLYPRLIEEGYDLTELHALMAPRPFLVSGGEADPESRWEALNHTIAVNRLLGKENRVAMSNRPAHSPDVESNEQIYQFFEYFLKMRN